MFETIAYRILVVLVGSLKDCLHNRGSSRRQFETLPTGFVALVLKLIGMKLLQ